MAATKDRTPRGVAVTGGPGRPKGTPNKVTHSIKDSLMNAYNRIGGDEALGEWAEQNQGEFYKLWAKLLPTKITGDGKDGKIQFSVVIRPHGKVPGDAEG